MTEYKDVMSKADAAAVFYSRHALQLKRMPDLPVDAVKKGFAREGLQVFNTRGELEAWLNGQDYTNANLLMMSSGNYDGMDMLTFAAKASKNHE
jgi:UDP-N-acetylmuramate: L-alanyl-gamma-D-glutamyl-meso-diaminopimelate ligase